jgi:hypothetical protein
MRRWTTLTYHHRPSSHRSMSLRSPGGRASAHVRSQTVRSNLKGKAKKAKRTPQSGGTPKSVTTAAGGVTAPQPKSVTLSGSTTLKPSTTTAVDIDPAQRYRGDGTPSRDVGRSTVTSGEITAVDKSVPTVAGDVAESVIVDETALLAGTGGLKAVLAGLVTGREVLALIDTLKTLIELSYAWLTYEKGGAGSEGAAAAHVMTLLQKNDPDIQAAFKVMPPKPKRSPRITPSSTSMPTSSS